MPDNRFSKKKSLFALSDMCTVDYNNLFQNKKIMHAIRKSNSLSPDDRLDLGPKVCKGHQRGSLDLQCTPIGFLEEPY